MAPKPSLSWGLVVVTYQRRAILRLCLQMAVRQTRKPQEIVVVDASEDWSETRDALLAELQPLAPDIPWTYLPARARSICIQRNQALERASADVVFLIDDDSLMYPTCAEEVMRVYEADVQGRVTGVQPQAVEVPPAEVEVADARKVTGHTALLTARTRLAGNFLRFMRKHVFLMDTQALHIPYDLDYPEHALPDEVAGLSVARERVLVGFRMTYRREAIVREKFEELLLYYAAGEDVDASYRVSRSGPLLCAREAKIYHFGSASGRLSRSQACLLSALNQALFLKKHASDVKQAKRRYYHLIVRRIVAEILKDLLSKRFSLPQVRGLLGSLKHSRRVFNADVAELEKWYPELQRQLVGQ